MKLGILRSNGTASALIDHSINLKYLAQGEKADVGFAEELFVNLEEIPAGMRVLNTCQGAQLAFLEEGNRKLLFESLDIHPGKSLSYLFGIRAFQEFSTLIELWYSPKMLTGSVGVPVGFATGVGLIPNIDPEEAVPQLSSIKKFLSDIDYYGEYVIGLDASYTPVSLLLGHFPAFLSMFMEVTKQSCSEVLEYLIGSIRLCEFYENSIVLGNMVSKFPFPSANVTGIDTHVHAPKSAEKHLWRMMDKGVELCLITVHAMSMAQAKQRMYHTINNMLRYDEFIQYRVDVGNKAQFVLCREQYQEFATGTVQANRESNPQQPS